MPTNKHNIDSLFEKAKSDIGNLDDFEKDAIAGIENYSSIKNVKELQTKIKRRFETEILKKSRRKPPTFYWLAAATLALLIGLSVFFIFINNQTLTRSKNIAINTARDKESYNNSDITRRNDKLPEILITQSNSISETNVSSKNNAESNLSKKTIAKYENKKLVNKTYPNINENSKVSEKEIPNQDQDMLAFTEENKSSTSSSMALENENKKKNDVAEKNVASTSKNNQVIMATPSVNSPENKSELLKSENINKSRETKKVEADEFVNCYYRGGEAEIIKDISNKLNSKKSSLKFDAIIFINQNKIVENVEFINSYSLTEIDKKEIIAVIKSLNNFEFFMAPTKKNNYKYKLSYNP